MSKWIPGLPNYQHKSLNTGENEIRILSLHGASADEERISCSLATRQLHKYDIHNDSDPFPPHGGNGSRPHGLSYEALSWAWGDMPKDRTLEIYESGHPHRFYISQGLAEALRGIRHHSLTRQLWVDAICIDQDKIDERNDQVKKMANIYAGASNVCVWLGPSDEYTKETMDFITQNMDDIWEFDKMRIDLSKKPLWSAFVKLLKKTWFHRRWVIQEIALARKATIHCGQFSMDWQQFSDAVALLVDKESKEPFSQLFLKNQPGVKDAHFLGNVLSLSASSLVKAVYHIQRNDEDYGRRFSADLETLVTNLTSFEATEPRDIIYALLAVATDAAPPTASTILLRSHSISRRMKLLILKQKAQLKRFRVDYSLPVIEVYKDFVQWAITESRDPANQLDIIFRPWAPKVEVRRGQDDGTDSFKQGNKIYIKLPSWMASLSEVPIHMEEHPTAGPQMERQSCDPLVGICDLETNGTTSSPYSASGRGKTRRSFEFVSRPGTWSLWTRGFQLDVIYKVWDVSQFGNVPFTWFKAAMWHNIEERPPEILWRTLVADRAFDGKRAPRYYATVCRSAVQRGWGKTYTTRRLIDESERPLLIEFLKRVESVIWNRRLVTLASGRIALAPESSEAGDHVCILYGSSVPVILKEMKKSPEQAHSEFEHEWQALRLKATLVVQRKWRLLRQLPKIPSPESRISMPADKDIRARIEDASTQSPDSRDGFASEVAESHYEESLADLCSSNGPRKRRRKGSKHVIVENNTSPYETAIKQEQEIDSDFGFTRRNSTISFSSTSGFSDLESTGHSHSAERPDNVFWKVKGECFLHGMMYGEALTYFRDKELKRIKFDLR